MAQAQGVREDIARVAGWAAWSGDRDALRRLCSAVETFAQTNLAREVAAIDAGTEHDALKEQMKGYATDRWRVTARASEPEYNRTRTGLPEEVIGALDERTVESFACDLSNYGDP